MSAQGRPVTDTRNDVAVKYVSTHTLPFVMISFGKAKVFAAWLKTRAMPLTWACPVHKKVRSVAGGAGPNADKFAAAGASHKKSTGALKAAGYKSTLAGTVATHTHIARPSSEEDQIAALVKLGTINSENLRVVCGATAFNSRVAMAAQTAILAKTENAAAEKPSAAAPELTQAEVAAAASDGTQRPEEGKEAAEASGSTRRTVRGRIPYWQRPEEGKEATEAPGSTRRTK